MSEEVQEIVTYTKDDLVKLIKKHHKASITNALECGRYLTILHQQLKWGEFEKTVEKELPFSIPTAQLYRRLYERVDRYPEHREAVLTMTLNEADDYLRTVIEGDMGAYKSKKHKSVSGWGRKRFVPREDDLDGGADEWNLRGLAMEVRSQLSGVEDRHGAATRKMVWARFVQYINGTGSLEGIPGNDDD